jgi:hypothetical protein
MAGTADEVPVVQDERIIFPEGTKAKDITPLCKKCSLLIDCLGFDSKGFVDFDFPRGRGIRNPNEYIRANAACLNGKER